MGWLQAVGFFFEPFAQSVNTQKPFSNSGFGWHEAHGRSRCRFANRRSIIGVIHAPLALKLTGCDQVRGKDIGVQSQGNKPMRPMRGTSKPLHGYRATDGQLHSPRQEPKATQLPIGCKFAWCVHSIDLDLRLCLICANSCNMVYRLFLQRFQTDFQNQSWHLCCSWKAWSPFFFGLLGLFRTWSSSKFVGFHELYWTNASASWR